MTVDDEEIQRRRKLMAEMAKRAEARAAETETIIRRWLEETEEEPRVEEARKPG